MKPQYETAKATVLRLAEKWQALLGLDRIKIEYVFVESFHDDGHSVIADTEAFWEYHLAKIRWFLPAMIRETDEGIEEDLVHELVHVLLNPIERHVPTKLDEQKEFTVESVTQAILSVHRAS